MSSNLSLSATISKYFNRLFRIMCASNNSRNKPPDVEFDVEFKIDEKTSAKSQNRVRKRTRAPAAAALSEDQDEMQAVQHRHSSHLSAVTPLGSCAPIVHHSVYHTVQASFCAAVHKQSLVSCVRTCASLCL